ncbi:protein-L-isoaspartate O-methyltransferase [Candidatus Pacearchaeota archaeon CG10_big_fil_rev_8_21_14_0_10_32_14]|nr:MAG: protein-L-isoaspartate O-methyltransferase [Candidatus Pacearchaeota archaeon CG10_big_fil_rev_8_21_14_0_10_32_14]
MKKSRFSSEKKELYDFWIENGIVKDKKIIDAFKKVPRQDFVLPQFIKNSYDDNSLPIGYNSTISQPTTIMMMLQWLELKDEKGFSVLEVGTGSGYNAALIGEICKSGKIVSLEIIPELIFNARQIIKKLKINNVEIYEEDGTKGFGKKAPYDRIIVTAACDEIPKRLIDQLKEGGKILVPVNAPSSTDYQIMMKSVKHHGVLITKDLGEFVFVKLRR